MNKKQLQQEIAELQKKLEEKQKYLAAMPDKWEPKGGCFAVGSDGLVHETWSSYTESRFFGVEYPSREQAEKASKAMRAHNRLLAYVAEFAPDWEPDWGDKAAPKFIVAFDNNSCEWFVSAVIRDTVCGAVYMPEHVAYELADKLNSGEVEL